MCFRAAVLVEQPEDRQCVRRTYEHFPAGYGRRNELVAGSELVAGAGGLVTVVKLVREVRRFVCMEHGGSGVFMGPNNSVRGPAGRHHWRSSGVGEGDGGL